MSLPITMVYRFFSCTLGSRDWLLPCITDRGGNDLSYAIDSTKLKTK